MSRSEQIVRETFIATKRHDLRTPINAILGYSEMLLGDRTFKLGSGTTSESGRYVKCPGGAP